MRDTIGIKSQYADEPEKVSGEPYNQVEQLQYENQKLKEEKERLEYEILSLYRQLAGR